MALYLERLMMGSSSRSIRFGVAWEDDDDELDEDDDGVACTGISVLGGMNWRSRSSNRDISKLAACDPFCICLITSTTPRMGAYPCLESLLRQRRLVLQSIRRRGSILQKNGLGDDVCNHLQTESTC
jgi:hypothetical protein